jgi:hypothetical protein
MLCMLDRGVGEKYYALISFDAVESGIKATKGAKRPAMDR